jgi:hypothetical protein
MTNVHSDLQKVINEKEPKLRGIRAENINPVLRLAAIKRQNAIRTNGSPGGKATV